MTRKILKYLRYSILTLIVLLFISFFVTQLDSVKKYFISFAVESFERETGYRLTVDEVELLLPFEVKGRGITVSQGDTLLASCDHLLLRLNPTTLLDKELNFHLLTMNGVHLHKPPKSTNVPISNTSDNEWRLTIRRYAIQQLTIDACISERLCVKPLNAEGSLHWDPHTSLSDASFIASVVSDSTVSPTEFGFHLQQDQDNIRIEMSVDEQEIGGILFPDGLGVHAAAELTSTVDNWMALLTQRSLKEEIDGPVAIKMTLAGEKSVEGTVKGHIAIVEGPSLHLKNFHGKIGKTEVSGALHLTNALAIDDSAIIVHSEDLSEFAHLLPNMSLDGKATFTAALQGTLTQPTVEVDLATLGMRINTYPLPASNLHALASWKLDRMEGTVDWSVNEGGGVEEDSHAAFQWVYGRHIALNDLHLALPSILIKANIGASLPSWAATGTIQGDFDDLSLLGKLLREPIAGQGVLEATFNVDDAEKQRVNIDLHALDFSFAGIKAEEAVVTSSLTNIYDGVKGTVELALHRGMFHQWDFDAMALTTEIDIELPAWQYHYEASGKRYAMESKGSLSFDDTQFVMNPQSFVGQLYGKELALQHPFSLHFGKSGAQITPMLMKVGNGTFYTSLEYANGQVYSTIRAVAIPLDLIDPGFYDAPIQGNITFDSYLYGEPTLLGGHLTATFDDLVIPAPALSKLPPLQATFSANVTNEGLFIKGIATGAEKTPIDINAQLPIHLMLTAPMVVIDNNRPLQAEIKATGPIAPLLELFITDTTTIVGDCAVDLHVSGTAATPIVLGTVTLSNASFESPAFGTQFHRINAKIECDGANVALKHFSAEDGKEGSITAKGNLILDPKGGFPYHYDATMVKARLLNLDDVKSSVSGTLSLVGDNKKAELKGQILSDKTTFSIPKKSSSLSDYVEVVYVNQMAEEQPPTLIKYEPLLSIPVAFDVTIGIPNTLSINDDSLKSSWKGEVKLGGDSNVPLLHGEIKLTDGEYLLNGKEFDLGQGTILFAGDPLKKTTLHVIALREINDIRVEIVLKGKLTDPDIALRSTPSLSQQEILSLILFGKAPSEITPHQDEQLEQSLSNLKVDDYEPGFFDRIQKTIGIDRIDINRDTTGQSEDVSIHVGKYITKDVYISVEKGLGDEPNSIGVEAKVLENVKLTVEGSDDVSGQVSLKWRHDY